MNLNLKGKRAIVRGGSQGIGKAVAIELAQLGAEVTLLARDKALLEEVRASLPTPTGQKHSALAVDFSNLAAVRGSIDELLKISPTFHILINNTGGPPGGPITEAKPEEFLTAFTNHLITNQIFVQALLPGMKSVKEGRIINIISTSVREPIPGLGVSNTTRAAVAGWAKTLAREVGPFGITVNNILPGATKTGRLEAILQNKSKKLEKSLEDVTRESEAEIPLKRFGEASEIAAAVAFLASPAGSYITGVSLPVDGGRLACI